MAIAVFTKIEIYLNSLLNGIIMAQSYSTTLQSYPLDKKKIVKKTISGIFIWALLFLFVVLPLQFFVYINFKIIFIILDFIFLLIFVIEPIYQNQYYKKYFYDVRPDFLMITKGVIMVREAILNYDKIQDVYMDQDILDRIFGLWDVHVSTATSMSGAEAHIDGVNHDNAMAIRELILLKIRNSKQRNG